MGGGALLMTFLLELLPAQSAMVFHGFIQFFSNGFRVYLFCKSIKWNIIAPYAFGAILAFIFFSFLKYVPHKSFIKLFLGIVLILSVFPISFIDLNITKRGRAFSCGLLVVSMQLLIGVAGGILDLFFVKGQLRKYQVIATKAVIQSLGHVTKIIYFSPQLTTWDDTYQIPFFIYPAVIVIAFLGAYLGKLVLDRLSENRFRTLSKALIILMGIFFILHSAIL